MMRAHVLLAVQVSDISFQVEGSARAVFGIVKPHRPFSTSCTIARWLKCVLKYTGIDVSMLTAHSVCGASSSPAAMVGVTTNDTLKAAGWSADSVFRGFYYRPVHSSSLAILSSGCSKFVA